MGDFVSKFFNVAVLIGLCVVGYFFLTTPSPPIEPPSDQWFQTTVVDQAAPVLVKFGAPWCGPCRMLDPELDKLEKSGQVNVVRIEIADHPELARHYGVTSIPRLLLFEHGNVRADRVGYANSEQLQSWIANSIN
ncbi:MAG TPA: thioredoxin domain-containing protein [Pirellulales bacterium]|nr:thioredoxin domain-containing protein [Pirellulales bacterium]